jgi:outer membrane protein assembly factor BamB
VKRYNGPAGNGDDYAYAIAVDGFGHVFVTGQSFGGPTSGYDYATVAYDATSGQQLWAARYDGPINGDDIAHAVAVDGLGNVYVTGQSAGGVDPFVSLDYATVAYDPSGGQLWAARYRGSSAIGDNIAYAIAVDGVGGVYVTGQSATRRSGLDYATVAYDAVTGTLRWVAGYNGPDNGDDLATAIAVDGLGQVYVTGTSWGATTNYDYATVAYDTLTGTQQWAARYNGPGNFWDNATAIAVDGAGGVYVTGFAYVTPANSNYDTLAYDALTGTQRWEISFGFEGYSSAARAIAVDSLGDVFVTGNVLSAEVFLLMYSQP